MPSLQLASAEGSGVDDEESGVLGRRASLWLARRQHVKGAHQAAIRRFGVRAFPAPSFALCSRHNRPTVCGAYRYLQSSKIAPAVARGVTKVVNMTIQSSPVDNIAICMGFPVEAVPSSAYNSMSAIFDAGDVSQSCYLDEFCNVPDKKTGKCDKNYPPKYPILNGPYGSWGKRPEYKDVRVDPDDKGPSR